MARHPSNQHKFSVRVLLEHLHALKPCECVCEGGESLNCERPCNEIKKFVFERRMLALLRHLNSRKEEDADFTQPIDLTLQDD